MCDRVCMCDLWTHRLVWHGTFTSRRRSPRQTVFVSFLSFLLYVCVCVIFGRIGLCGTVLLRHDVEVRDKQSLFV